MIETILLVGEVIERRDLRRFQRQRRELPRRDAEIFTHVRVIFEQQVVFENEVLARNALERRRLFEHQTARPPRLGRLQHFRAGLRRQAVERQDQFGECVDQRQADQQEAQQDELEERTGVIHAGSAAVSL